MTSYQPFGWKCWFGIVWMFTKFRILAHRYKDDETVSKQQNWTLDTKSTFLPISSFVLNFALKRPILIPTKDPNNACSNLSIDISHVKFYHLRKKYI